jgi:hypothetical protein
MMNVFPSDKLPTEMGLHNSPMLTSPILVDVTVVFTSTHVRNWVPFGLLERSSVPETMVVKLAETLRQFDVVTPRGSAGGSLVTRERLRRSCRRETRVVGAA